MSQVAIDRTLVIIVDISRLKILNIADLFDFQASCNVHFVFIELLIWIQNVFYWFETFLTLILIVDCFLD